MSAVVARSGAEVFPVGSCYYHKVSYGKASSIVGLIPFIYPDYLRITFIYLPGPRIIPS